ncbi:HTH domain-containing protein [Cardinium endosymbiont of Dermatophagoides farinae]|uniref:HTH domain-containing protein n=1 Tax=Cardinium endosymbiont of Dermatophagoides farinae TaxID=2597823 RepID=UPI001CB996A8|nr:HTH domain-containing protein [Cardinium endosymbiont of Dermatophagoides farinae]
MVQLLAVNPYFTINKIAKELSISYSTAQRGVQKLEAAGILKKTGNNKRDKVYCAIDILNILEEPTHIKASICE